ncbi:MAG: preprotein translocase subunit YajC [Nocardioides sp.]|uniref:preprotein translocase subunit YajC n=1 Tax=Nocardioides sp. TaxID=35761 RepID=UPI0039E3A676
MTLLPLLLIVVVFWFLLIRPQQRRAKEARAMQNALGPGERVMLTSGIFGEVVRIEDDHIVVSIADGVEIKVVRAAIGNVIPPDVADDSDSSGGLGDSDGSVDDVDDTVDPGGSEVSAGSASSEAESRETGDPVADEAAGDQEVSLDKPARTGGTDDDLWKESGR